MQPSCNTRVAYPRIVGVTHMAAMRFVAFPRQWEEVNKIDCEVIPTNKEVWIHVDIEEWVPPPLDIHYLELQNSFFKITMISHAQVAMSLPVTKNPMSWVWRKLSSNVLISTKLSEFMKVVEIAHIQVLGSVENERTFSSLSFLKSKLRNQLTWSRLGGMHVCTRLLHIEHIPLPSNNFKLKWLEGSLWRGRVDEF